MGMRPGQRERGQDRLRESRHGRRWPKRLALALLTLVLVVVAYVIGLYFWGDSRLRHTDAFDTYADQPSADPGADWLLIGSDSRSELTSEQRKKLHVGNNEVFNTDTIMVLHYGDSGPYLVSIPRDSYVAIPGHGKNKINAAYALGGPKLLTRTVEQATGLKLDHYAEVNFLGFVDVVDSLGGVTICVAKGGLHDEKSGADFDAGCQRMDGTQALAYVRARYSDPLGDLGRVRRQRQLVSAVADKAMSAAVVVPPWRLIPWLGASFDALTVDDGTGVRDLAQMGWRMKELAGGEGATTTVPVGEETTVEGVGDVVEWDSVKAEQLFSALRDDTTIPASDLK
ncbi:LCP family protein [Streptomyces sp. NBC_00658]|uniref:LCP family protein n=1 Tax=Streptomyces sp. NBC_00658 TaxID=2975800 RepID=UPI0032562E7A